MNVVPISPFCLSIFFYGWVGVFLYQGRAKPPGFVILHFIKHRGQVTWIANETVTNRRCQPITVPGVGWLPALKAQFLPSSQNLSGGRAFWKERLFWPQLSPLEGDSSTHAWEQHPVGDLGMVWNNSGYGRYRGMWLQALVGSRDDSIVSALGHRMVFLVFRSPQRNIMSYRCGTTQNSIPDIRLITWMVLSNIIQLTCRQFENTMSFIQHTGTF